MPINTDQNLHQQNTDIAIIEALIPFLKNKTFIDIGAEKGTFTEFLHSLQFRGVFFEPLPTFAPELTALSEKSGCTFLPYAVDSTDRNADFFVATDHSGNPVDHFSSLHALKKDERITHKKIANVICRSMDSLKREGLIAASYGIVKIDTEGNDLNVLKGMNEVDAEVLMCEYFMPGIYAGWENGHPQGLINEIKKFGYRHCIAIKRIDVLEFLSIDDLEFIEKQWGNLIFMKDEIFLAAKSTLDEVYKEHQRITIKKVAETVADLRVMCEERYRVIESLHKQLQTFKSLYGIRDVFKQTFAFMRGKK